jgi:hypothetical protein
VLIEQPHADVLLLAVSKRVFRGMSRECRKRLHRSNFASRRMAVGLAFGLTACGATGNPTPTHQLAPTPTTGNAPAGPGGVDHEEGKVTA